MFAAVGENGAEVGGSGDEERYHDVELKERVLFSSNDIETTYKVRF